MNAATLRLLVEKGLSAQDILEIAEAMEARSDPTAAARQQRLRDRRKQEQAVTRDGVTRDVTRDVRAPLDKEDPHTPKEIKPQAPPIVPPKRERGTRLTANFQMPDEWRRWALAERGWSGADVDAEAASFRDYWVSKPGAGAVKLDWEATWRNWVRSSHRKTRVAAGAWDGAESPC